MRPGRHAPPPTRRPAPEAALLAGLGALLAASVVVSLGWRMQHDAPLMLYVAFLMDRFGAIPYCDIFDFNLPGAHLTNLALGRSFGYSDLGFRLFDLLLLAVLSAATWAWLSPAGRKSAGFGTIAFALLYLHFGPSMSLQREYIGLVAIAGALAVVVGRPTSAVRSFAAGALVGAATMVKPLLSIGLPVLLVFLIRPMSAARRLGTCAAVVLGFACPVAAALLYVQWSGGLNAFRDVVTGYWPLYARMGGDLTFRSGLDRLQYLATSQMDLGGQGLWLLPGGIAVYISLLRPQLPQAGRERARLVSALAATYAVYPLLQGKFWSYHWLPFAYFAIALAALCLAWRTEAAGAGERWAVVALLAGVTLVTAYPHRAVLSQITGRAPLKDPRVDEVASFLQARLGPEDRVQPLDWTSGAVHAMLIARARIATPFLYDFYFYHDVSSGYVQRLRRRFLEELVRMRPRFVIQFERHRAWPLGVDTTRRFEALEEILSRDYRTAHAGDGFRILERIAAGPPATP